MNKIDLVRQFVNTITKCTCVIAKERDDWGMNIDERQPRLTLPHDLRQNTQEDKQVFYYQRFFQRNYFSSS